jgi:tRNA-splicing endonuclease subunit Sen2
MATSVETHMQSPSQANGGTMAQKEEKANARPKKAHVARPNYNKIHEKPLPVEIYPLPAFIPHNPLSIVRVAVTLLSHSLWPPKSHPIIHQAYLSTETQSVHVTDPSSVRALWEQGFWGKGSLSRSEPRWLDQEKRKRGVAAAQTSEEYTRRRREERRQFKLERAKAQRDIIEQQLREEGKLGPDGNVEELVDDGDITESPKGTLYSPDTDATLGNIATNDAVSVLDEVNKTIIEDASNFGDEIVDQEHLQLTFEETFFLTYVLGVLNV